MRQNYYVLNKTEYLRTVTAVQTQPLNYQPNYKYDRKSQPQGVLNQLMFTQHGKTWYDEGKAKYEKQKNQRNLDQITWNCCGRKYHYMGNSECSIQNNIKEDAEEFSNMKQGKYGNNTPGVGGYTTLVNVKYSSCSIMMGISTK